MFLKEERQKIIEKLKEKGFECLIVCGGNGSLEGAKAILRENFNTIFIPMSVDNDINYTEYSIGYNTTLNKFLNIIQDIHNTSYNLEKRYLL